MIIKKTVFVVLILTIFSICTSSCSSIVDTEPADISIENTESEVIIEMTKDQKKFLLNNSINEESVNEGRLRGWQIRLLSKYDYCMDYLSQKYEAHSFEITTYESISPSLTKFVVIPDEDETLVFTVNVFEDGKHISATDTFE